MTDKQIKLDGSWIPIEEAIKAGLISENDIKKEQIIIDGVDVSGCSFYKDNPKYRMWETCDCMRTMIDQSGYDELAGAECKGHNCYYKQLKAKEQECERLNARLRPLEDSYFNGLSSIHIAELAKKSIRITAENRKLEQTLTEIKEIAEKIANYYDGDEYELMRKDAEQILQKISECEGNNE